LKIAENMIANFQTFLKSLMVSWSIFRFNM